MKVYGFVNRGYEGQWLLMAIRHLPNDCFMSTVHMKDILKKGDSFHIVPNYGEFMPYKALLKLGMQPEHAQESLGWSLLPECDREKYL